MLSFDVYLKKAMIEKIIDELLVPAQEERKTKKDGGKKTAKGDGKKEDAAEEAKTADEMRKHRITKERGHRRCPLFQKKRVFRLFVFLTGIVGSSLRHAL